MHDVTAYSRAATPRPTRPVPKHPSPIHDPGLTDSADAQLFTSSPLNYVLSASSQSRALAVKPKSRSGEGKKGCAGDISGQKRQIYDLTLEGTDL